MSTATVDRLATTTEEPAGRSSSRAPVPAALFVLGIVLASMPGWLGGASLQVTPDSGAYLSTAQNLVDGRGVTTPYPVETTSYSIEEQLAFDGAVPFTEWPPLYPVALGVLMAAGAGAVDAAQLLNTLALAATLVLTSLLARRLCGGRAVPVAAATALVLLGPVASTRDPLPGANPIGQSLLVLSEALYLPLFLGALLLATYATGPRAGSGRRVRGGGAALVAAATLTRFVGVAAGVGAAGALALRNDRRRQVGRIAVLLAAGPVALVMWSLLRTAWWGAGSGEVVAWHPPGADQLRDLLDVLGSWCLLPPSLPWPVRAVVVCCVGGALLAVALHPRWRRQVGGPELAVGRPAGDLLSALVIAAVAHVLIVLATVTFVDAWVPLSQRTLGVAQVALYLAAVGLVTGWVLQQRVSVQRPVALVGAVAVLLACAPGALWLVGAREQPVIGGGGGGAVAAGARRPEGSEASGGSDEASGAGPARLVPDVPDDMVVVTNNPGLLWFDTQAQLLLAPRRTAALTGERNPDLAIEAAEVAALLARRDGIVVLHDMGTDGTAVRDSLVEHGGLVALGGCGTPAEVLATRTAADRISAQLGC